MQYLGDYLISDKYDMSDSPVSAAEFPDSFGRLYDNPHAVATSLRERAGDPAAAKAAACLFAALSNPQRLQLLWTLREGECCVCELQTALDAPQSTVATQLRCLTEAGLIRARNDGKWTYYRVADPHIFELIEQAPAIGEGDPAGQSDDDETAEAAE